MKTLPDNGLAQVQAVYSGAEGRLWELIMGEQIHIGGLSSSMALAEMAGIHATWKGVDFCCCSGAGMRFLVRFCKVASMTGVDATEAMIRQGIQRCRDEGLSESIRFVHADVCDSGLPAETFDFVWGEDAWCYVTEKEKLVAEAARLLRPGGTVAFTDWLEGDNLSEEEAARFMRFMKFPSLYNLNDYRAALQKNSITVCRAEDSGRFPGAINLYLDMLNNQLTYDALKIIGFDTDLLQALGVEMTFIQALAREKKIIQGMIIGKKNH